jgi:hypothetical protein
LIISLLQIPKEVVWGGVRWMWMSEGGSGPKGASDVSTVTCDTSETQTAKNYTKNAAGATALPS